MKKRVWQLLADIFSVSKKPDGSTAFFHEDLNGIQAILNRCQVKYVNSGTDPFDWRVVCALTYLNLAQRMLMTVREFGNAPAEFEKCRKMLYELAMSFESLADEQHFDDIMHQLQALECEIAKTIQLPEPRPALKKEYQVLIASFEENYHKLKQCFVVMRRGVIDEALNRMHISIQALENVLSDDPLNEAKVFYHFQQIFFSLECIQFNTQRDSRSSKHLFEMAHLARINLHHALNQVEIGRMFLTCHSREGGNPVT